MNRFAKVAIALSFACLPSIALAGPAETQKPLAPQTKANLEAAMHGEAFANLKYQRYADLADAHGEKDLARLFRQSANVEASEHFDREAQALQLGGADPINLMDAMAGEHHEYTQMYLDYAKQAAAAGDSKVAAMFLQIAHDEETHYKTYKDALAQLHHE